MLSFDGPAADIFDVFVQLGAILSVIFIYKERFARFFTKEGWQADKGLSVWHVAVGIVPVMGVAFFAYKYIKEYLFSPFTVAIGLVLGALDKISLKQAALVGAFQLLSLWPGFSRSGSTLAGGLLVGLKRETAANYTFLIAVPLMFVACLYDLLKNISILTVDDLQMLAIGFVVAFVVAYWSVLWFLKFLHKYSLTSFAYYRIILAVAALTYFYF